MAASTSFPRSEPSGFYDALALFPFLSHLPSEAPSFLAELRAAPAAAWHAWPETTLYMREDGVATSWKVVPFCYTFPSDTGEVKWVASSCAVLPRISAALRSIPGLRIALLSRLGPGTRLSPHQGWKEISNHVLRVHLTLYVPARGCSGVVVEGAGGASTRAHAENELICFDDSLTHSAFKDHPSEDRVVLIFDILRPAGVAPGTAVDGATAELSSFMAYFN